MDIYSLRSGILVSIVLGFGCASLSGQDKKLVLGEQETFSASRTHHAITVDGKMEEGSWSKTEVRALEYFYGVVDKSDEQKTDFRMLWDDENLYLFFSCEDQYLTASEINRDGRPYLDDCAEIFLIPAPDSLAMHFGIELNLYKASNDFIYLENIYQGKKGSVYSYNPDFQVEVTTDGTINDNSDIDVGWTMEIAIPLKLFKGMENFSPVKAGNQWAFLALRQERNDPEPGRRLCSTIFPVYGIENVHHARRFGLLKFVD